MDVRDPPEALEEVVEHQHVQHVLAYGHSRLECEGRYTQSQEARGRTAEIRPVGVRCAGEGISKVDAKVRERGKPGRDREEGRYVFC